MFHIRTFIIVIVALFGVFFGSGLFAQNAWETLPVFHNGRVMPLHTFAQQNVREICGTTRPFIVQDYAVMAEFNQITEALRKQDSPELGGTATKFRFLTPAPEFLDGGLNREWSVFDLASDVQPVKTELPIQGLDRFYIENIVKRVRQLIPLEGRYFTADEILFSWICEPEIWQYIPVFLVPETDYLDEVFGVSAESDVRTSQYRISLHQLENSQRYKQRLAEISKRRELGQTTGEEVRFNQITERLERQAQMFRELTFHPQRYRPTRMISLLYQTAGATDGQSSYAFVFEAWWHLLALGDVPGRQATARVSDSSDLIVLHPTTQRWHDIEDKLHLLVRIYDRTDSVGKPVFPNALVVEQQFEALIDLLDKNLVEAVALMETVYPGIPYRPEGKDDKVDVQWLLPMLGAPENQQNQATIRQIVSRYYYAVKKLRKEVEAAYLALYDNGRALRFLPVLSPLTLEAGSSQDNFGVQPWASAQMILGSGDTFVRRFLEPQIEPFVVIRQIPTQETNETGITEKSASPDSVETTGLDPSTILTEEVPKESQEPLPDETRPNVIEAIATDPSATPGEQFSADQLFQPSGQGDWMSRVRLDERSIVGHVRARLQVLFASYTAPGSGYNNNDFSIPAREFQESAVRPAAARIEAHRKLLAENENEHIVEQFVKTGYPDPDTGLSKLLMEYRYSRFDPFYWMWVFALGAVFLNGGAYVTAMIRRARESVTTKSISIHSAVRGKEDEETEMQDYTNTLEEWLFIGSVIMLTFSMLIAFIGGAMRASITGWAPVTNMYETVVMMALTTAIIGVWYALYPLLHPALKLAWVYSNFPSIGTLLELFAAIKAQKSVSPPETAGETAMREAAIEFGVPGAAGLGSHSAYAQNQGPVVFDSLRRVKAAQRKIEWQCLLTIPRLMLTFAVFYAIVLLANEEKFVAEQGFWAAAVEMFATSDVVDWLAIVVSTVLLVWIVPHLLLTFLVVPVVLCWPAWVAAEQGIRSFESRIIVEQVRQKANAMGRVRSEMGKFFHGEGQDDLLSHDTSGAAWLKQARNAALDRKLFIAITAAVVFMAGLAASLNRAEFNPDIRPIAAVLRSNFWLTVHVAAFVVGYAAAFIAWGMAAVSLGYVVFGRYRRMEPAFEGHKTRILLPDACQLFSPAIERLIRIALLFLIAGTVLGGRWADYSWGRFWSWDPKEVWALITIFFLVIVFHGKTARYYGVIGITVGALFASIAVVITWYGINYAFKGNSVHAYGGGTESHATLFLIVFIVANILWGTLALLRYCAEVYGNEADE